MDRIALHGANLWIISAEAAESQHDWSMFMSSDPLRWPTVVSLASMPKRESQALKRQGWWSPTRGFLVEPQKEALIHHQDYYLGYVRALVQQDSQSVIFAGTTAAMLLGHPVWPYPTDVVAYKNNGRREARALSPYPRANRNVCFRPMRDRAISEVIDVGQGVRTTTREQTAVDVARLAASQTAFIIVCSILGLFASSGDTYQDRTDPRFLEREAAARARMMEIAEALPNTGGRRRAMQVISAASGQVESLAEARVLWIIRAYGLPSPAMQYRILVDGREFFGDFVWPDKKLVVEFNGEGKYGDDEKSRRVAEERARESLLRSAGYEVVNLSWKQLQDPAYVARLIHKFLNSGSLASAPLPRVQQGLMRPEKPVRSDFGSTHAVDERMSVRRGNVRSMRECPFDEGMSVRRNNRRGDNPQY